jgi:hypothetical protein
MTHTLSPWEAAKFHKGSAQKDVPGPTDKCAHKVMTKSPAEMARKLFLLQLQKWGCCEKV